MLTIELMSGLLHAEIRGRHQVLARVQLLLDADLLVVLAGRHLLADQLGLVHEACAREIVVLGLRSDWRAHAHLAHMSHSLCCSRRGVGEIDLSGRRLVGRSGWVELGHCHILELLVNVSPSIHGCVRAVDTRLL